MPYLQTTPGSLPAMPWDTTALLSVHHGAHL
jgi:hypothetical protein